MEKQVKEITNELLNLIGIEAEVVVREEGLSTQSGEGEDLSAQAEKAVNVIISADESGLLIGSHGSTLQAIQSFLALALRQQEGSWVRVIVDIGDWREKQKENLVSLGKQAAQRAKQTGEPQYLYNLTPAQRREIHVSLKEDNEIETESEGEGADRYLIIKAKS